MPKPSPIVSVRSSPGRIQLQQVGLTAKIVQAKSIDALNKIIFDPEDIDVALAID
jgi:hypothetical protein